MRAYHPILLFLSGCFFFIGCASQKDRIAVVATNFGSEVEQLQNLTFSFNRDIYPDSLLQKWDSTGYVEFTPKVRGLFKWNSSSELVFSPAERFLPGTEYAVRLTPRLLDKSALKLPLAEEPLQFRTAPLRVAGTHLSWTRGRAVASVVVQLDLSFNYEVDVQEAAAHIQLAAGGQTVHATTINGGRDKTVSLQFAPVTERDEETELKISVTKGIKLTEGGAVSARDTQLVAQIPSRYTMTVTGMTGHHNGTEGTIIVSTSQPLHDEGLKTMIKLEPEVPFEVALNDAGFIITSRSFKAEQTYGVHISSRLEGLFGGRMKRDYYEQAGFGKLEPAIQFANSKGLYLSSLGAKNVSLNIVNVPKVVLSIVKVYENNIEQFMHRDRDWGYDYDGEDYHSYNYYNTENLGDTVFSQVYETAKLPRLNSARVLHLDFKDKLKGYDGVYVVTVASTEHQWVQSSKILSLSDIGLIVKEEKDNIYVFANSIRNATALRNVKISFIGTNNQRLHTVATDNDGVAIFSKADRPASGFRTALITAKYQDDFSFVWLSQSRVETSRFDVGGHVMSSTGLNAMIYAERNLYRPGETIQVSAIVRDEDWNTPGEVPVKLRLTMPNGREFATMRKILNSEGATETSFALPPSAMTGTYVLQAFTGNDVLLNTDNISVEDFVPDRIKLTLSLDREEYKAGDSIAAVLKADNLFGTPAGDRNYEAELNISKVAFTAKEFKDYNFNITSNFEFNTELRSGKTNSNGAAVAMFVLKPELRDAGMLQGNVMATVFDETGRPVHRYQHFTVYTQPVFVGLQMRDQYVSTRKPFRVGLIAVNKQGALQNNVPIQLTLIRKEWHTVIEQEGSRYKYVSRASEKVVSQQVVRSSGASAGFAYTPELSGEYELRAAVQGANSYVSQKFYAYGWGDTEYTSFEVNNEGNVRITTDKDRYAVGEEMDVLFTTPFDGRMLVTMERDRVMRHFYVETKNKSASVKLKADNGCVPNVYITATLFRPMDGLDMPLTVAHGFRSVAVENASNHLPLQLSVAERSRSRNKQTITVKTAPGAMVTIAAVDEGILQIRNYRTPDPYQYFYQKQALGTSSYDIYPLLLPEIDTRYSSTGGDGADESEMRVNPMFVNRVKNVSFWSGIRQADANGVVKYDIEVPQFSGDIRVMAVAYKGRSFAGTDKHMKVADPVVVSTGLPRFFSPGDQALMPVTLSNTTAREMQAEVTVKTEGPLGVEGSSSATLRLPANRESRSIFTIAAQKAIGAGKVTVVVRAGGESFVHETEISIRPPASLQKVTGYGIASEGNSAEIHVSDNFIPSTIRGRLIVGKSPLVQFARNLSDLVRYPHGCLEQTVSAVFPQLYYQDLVTSLGGSAGSDPNPAYNVQQAINKLQSMQLSNGSLSYWPGRGSENWWGSVYAAHFLIEARKAGFEVNSKTLERLLEYMKYKLSRKETEILYYNETLKKEIAAKEIAYSLYVLAMVGQAQLPTMNYYKAHPELLSIDSKYLLAASYTAAGSPAQAKAVLPSGFGDERANQSSGGNFYSWIRDEAISLNSLLDTDPDNPQVGILAKHLSEQLKASRYLNTQENAFSVLALGKMAREANKTTASAAVYAGKKQISATSGQTVLADLRPWVGTPVTIKVNGKGNYYYFWETSGITADGSYVQEDRYLRVRRQFFDRNGKEISNNHFRQNDLVVVRISLEALQTGSVENVAITDMLPAGLEIENTRLNEMPGLKWIKEAATPDYMDIRDDRVSFFTTATPAVKRFYYMARAVSPGVFQLGPVQADAMYRGEYHSYHGAGRITIAE